MRQGLRAVSRLLSVVGFALRGLLIIVFKFPRLGDNARAHHVQAWAAGMLARMGIELHVTGAVPAQGPILLVSNHISWLDILVIHAARHCRFISKASVRQWPLIGRLATGAGTLYIERESRRDAMRVVHATADALRAGDIVAVFPEGTTGDGVTLLPFHGNLIQAAISAQAPVQPIALGYRDMPAGTRSIAPTWIGDETLARSVWRVLAAQDLHAWVRFDAPQRADGRDRRAWAADLRSRIAAMYEGPGPLDSPVDLLPGHHKEDQAQDPAQRMANPRPGAATQRSGGAWGP